MEGVPPTLREKIKEAIRRPRGTFGFRYNGDDLFNQDLGPAIILEVTAGSHIFRLERDQHFVLNFYHSSPGTGTRVASVQLGDVELAERVRFLFTWEPSGINFYVRPLVDGAHLHRGEGSLSGIQLRVGSDGSIFQLDDTGIAAFAPRVYSGSNPIVLPTALELWAETVQSANALYDAIQEGEHFQEVAICNSILTNLVTGFESYGRSRFVELEGEGIRPDIEALLSATLTRRQLGQGLPKLLGSEANDLGISLLRYLVEDRRINFQNYDQAKTSFKAAFGIRFGDLAVSSQLLERLQKLIAYRHTIVHVSPLLSYLNQESFPEEEPEFSKAELALEAVQVFQDFVEALHNATLELDRLD